MGTTNSSFRPFLSSMAFVLSTLISAYAFPEPTANSTTSHGVNGIAEPSALVSAARHLKSTADDVDLDECFKDLCQSESYLAEIKQRCKDQSDWHWDWACDWLEFHDVYTEDQITREPSYDMLTRYEYNQDQITRGLGTQSIISDCREADYGEEVANKGSTQTYTYNEVQDKAQAWTWDKSFGVTSKISAKGTASVPLGFSASTTSSLETAVNLGHSGTQLEGHIHKNAGTIVVDLPTGKHCTTINRTQTIEDVMVPFVATTTIKGLYSTEPQTYGNGPYAAQCCYLSGLWFGASDCGGLGRNGRFGNDNDKEDYWFAKMVTAKDIANHPGGQCNHILKMKAHGSNDAQFEMLGKFTGGFGMTAKTSVKPCAAETCANTPKQRMGENGEMELL